MVACAVVDVDLAPDRSTATDALPTAAMDRGAR
jgi:hypothetical protein